MNMEECGVHILRDYAEMHETSSSFSSTSTGSSASMDDEYLHWNEQERGDCGSSVSVPAKSFPFTREQQQKKTRLTKTDVISRFDLSLAEAATSLNVCTTMLKRECRRMGVTRWPYRQIRKQRKLIKSLEKSITDKPPKKPRGPMAVNFRARKERRLWEALQKLRELEQGEISDIDCEKESKAKTEDTCGSGDESCHDDENENEPCNENDMISVFTGECPVLPYQSNENIYLMMSQYMFCDAPADTSSGHEIVEGIKQLKCGWF